MSYKERLSKETSDLFNKLTKLNEFLVSDKIDQLSFPQVNLLYIQELVMGTYMTILEARMKQIEYDEKATNIDGLLEELHKVKTELEQTKAELRNFKPNSLN